MARCASRPEMNVTADATASADTTVPDLPVIRLSEGPAFPLEHGHLESSAIAAGEMSFEQIFEAGAALFHTPFNGLDGVGVARLPNGSTLARLSVVPAGGGAGGMTSSQSCGECHNAPAGTSAGLATTNRAGDPDNDGVPPFNVRSTTSLFGDGIVQLLAQEMTEELQSIRTDAEREARATLG